MFLWKPFIRRSCPFFLVYAVSESLSIASLRDGSVITCMLLLCRFHPRWYLVFALCSIFAVRSCSIVYKSEEKVGSSFMLSYTYNLVILLCDIVLLVWGVVNCMYVFCTGMSRSKTPSIVLIGFVIAALVQGARLWCCVCFTLVSVVIVLRIWSVASRTIPSYDESYSVLSLLRLSFLSEKRSRVLKLGNQLFLALFFSLQYCIVRYSRCSSSTLLFALISSVLFLM